MIDPLILAQIGVGWLFIRYLIQKDSGSKEPRSYLWTAGMIGFLATIIAIFAEKWALPHTFVDHPRTLAETSLFKDSILVGIIEESAKSLPLALFLYGRKYFNEMNDGILFFGIGGMVFGVIEDIGYELAFPGSGVMRLLTGPYLHAGFCVLFGYTLATKKIQKRSWLIVFAGWTASVMFHGIYDFGLFYSHAWSLLLSLGITIAINLNIFYLLKLTRKQDEKLGLASAGSNYYCRHCGQPNPNRYLYCTYCGHKT